MAGHSKWANIQHRKGRQDEKRGRIWTRIIREIVVAARAGGGDKDYNDFVFSFRSDSLAPEPETNVLMLAGLMAVAWLSRRRKSTRF